jgi:hypothetical protein
MAKAALKLILDDPYGFMVNKNTVKSTDIVFI